MILGRAAARDVEAVVVAPDVKDGALRDARGTLQSFQQVAVGLPLGAGLARAAVARLGVGEVTSSGIESGGEEEEEEEEDNESAFRAGATTAEAQATASAAVAPFEASWDGEELAQSQRWRSESWKRTVGRAGGGGAGGVGAVGEKKKRSSRSSIEHRTSISDTKKKNECIDSLEFSSLSHSSPHLLAPLPPIAKAERERYACWRRGVSALG